MLRRLRPRSLYDVLATLAFFGVLTGGVAYAANTIGSADIIDSSILTQDIKNGQVTKDDLAADAVRTGKVLDESLTGHDIQDNTIGGADVNETLLNPLTSPQIKDESLTGHDIQDDTIGGADVNESLLDPLTNAQIQDESLTGHDIQDDTIGGADVNESLLDGVPYSPAFSTHNAFLLLPSGAQLGDVGAEVQVIYTGDGTHGDPFVHVRVPGIVMASATLGLQGFANHGIASVFCSLGLVRPGDASPTKFGAPVEQRLDPSSNTTEVVSLNGAKAVNTPGDYHVNVVCRASGEPEVTKASLIAWAM